MPKCFNFGELPKAHVDYILAVCVCCEHYLVILSNKTFFLNTNWCSGVPFNLIKDKNYHIIFIILICYCKISILQ